MVPSWKLVGRWSVSMVSVDVRLRGVVRVSVREAASYKLVNLRLFTVVVSVIFVRLVGSVGSFSVTDLPKVALLTMPLGFLTVRLLRIGASMNQRGSQV